MLENATWLTKSALLAIVKPKTDRQKAAAIVGRLDHWKADYLRNFDENVATIGLAEIKRQRLATALNPLMFPTLHVLKKHQ